MPLSRDRHLPCHRNQSSYISAKKKKKNEFYKRICIASLYCPNTCFINTSKIICKTLTCFDSELAASEGGFCFTGVGVTLGRQKCDSH